MSQSQYQKKTNEITKARPHHRLVEDMERLFIGQYCKPRPVVFPVWRVVNEWLVICSICLLASAVIDFIIRI